MTALGEHGPVAVVGAGPAGALLAVFLAREGHEVDLYEKRSDMRRVEVDAGRSINLALATRGIVPLVDIGVIERVDEITIPMRGRLIHAEDADDLTLQPYGSHPHEVIHSVSRRDLNAILLDAAEERGVAIRFEHDLSVADLDARVLHFDTPAGAVERPFGVVVGADGAGSLVREAVLARGGGTADTDWLSHSYKELELPPSVEGGFQIDPNALHIWPRGEFMLIALANPEGDFTVTLFAPDDGPDSFETLRSDRDVERFFATEFADFVPLVPDLVEQFQANPTGRLATMRATGWSYGDRAVLLGDAAHAIVPFHGQGMNLAMESARALDRHLRARPDDVAAAFTAFEAERKPDADAIADMALDNYVEMRSSVIDPGYVLRRQLALELERRHPDRMSPRYNMVMFSTMPYSEARRRAERQADILSRLTEGIDAVSAVDFAAADRLVAELDPLPDLDPLARPDALSVT